MKKILLFPYHPDLKTLTEHKDFLKGYQIAGFVSYIEDKGLIYSLNQSLGLEDMPYDQLLEESDTVILLDNFRGYDTEKYYQIIKDAISHQKELLITPSAQSQLDLKEYRGQYRLLELLPEGMDAIEEEYTCMQEIKIYDIDVPVIGVFGQGKNCDKFENQLLIKEVLEEEYEAITVTTNALGVLFGCYTMPSFLFENTPFQEKIIKFNHYIRKISKQDNLDVIILGIPEGIAPFEMQEYHHFAEYPLVVSSAVSIDMAILCTYFMRGPKLEYGLKKVAEYCRNKFNVPVGAIAIARTAVEIPNEIHEKLVFAYLDHSYLCKYYPDIKRIDLPLINILNREEAAATIKMSLRQLQENASAV
ncbi:peptide maturation system protein, TIGR04066 family [Sporobacter termitidis DSM 10068]|uniref:Peptide maturation system protein, TIGR04066 family n=1 Tax=Sporobacter termitidis DSM 10068 TaxID=1123282 RepID=A0A1M5WBC0_9FIRM|nr:TIGR04066 family peptide maturation system protein [Sporobacter termitidis]SHH84889.1 peptide maturation system protein, TIGR04066 family [Sporobacter termitidis DSM 10068]